MDTKEEVGTTITLKEGDVVLESGKDMTLTRFITWLNSTFTKTSGTKFTAQDAYGYIKRGNLPYHYGVYQLKEYNYPEIGLKVVRVIDLNQK